MKTLFIILIIISVTKGFTQTKGISYQALILNPKEQKLPGLDAKRSILVNTKIVVRFSINDEIDELLYKELHSTQTDRFGMVSLLIGSGERVGSKRFNNISWDGKPKNLLVEIDFLKNSQFTLISKQELTYMPQPSNEKTELVLNHLIEEQTNIKEDISNIQLIPGPIGPQGSQGVPGVQGLQGFQGDTGIQGIQGDTGIQGLQGDAGTQGIQGDAGTQGLQGDTGVQGIQGDTGIQGLQGDAGTQGIQGDAGIQGIQGDAGTQGIQGDTGVQGIEGDTGIQGLQGDTGTQGIQGDAGIQGIQGDAGTQGIQGDTGVQGIQGDTGTQGIQGDAGVQGIQGDTGIQGIQGDTGTQGLKGDTGIQGLQGDTGIQGLTGASGIEASSDSFVDLSTTQSVSGNKTFTDTVTASISGNAATVTTNANLIGAISSVGNNTSIEDGVVTNPKLDKAHISLSGFGDAEADISLGAHKLTELADPVSAQDAATKNYVDRTHLISSIAKSDIVTTNSSQNTLVSGMTLTPGLGTYLVMFNGNMSSEYYFSTSQGNLDVTRLYTDLLALPGGISHQIIFGGEILLPGIYDATGATSIAGTLTLDGQGDPNSLFIIRSTGAITTGANTIILLTNQANAGNVFWVSEGTITTTAPTIMKGTFVANQAAIALGANTNMEGRMFSVVGALTMGADSSLTKPGVSAMIDLGTLSTFAMYTSVGAVSDCATCAVIGDVGTGLGVISGFATIDGTIYPAGTGPSDYNFSTFGIYQNGLVIPHSERKIKGVDATVSLQALVTQTLDNLPIEIHWKVSGGISKIGARNLSLIPSGN